jgi:axial budding pattern protein 2
MLVLTLLSVLYASCVSAKPTLNYAIQAQLPEIARAGEQYDWALYPNTFNSTSGSLSYTTSTLPSWLNFDEPSLTFHGSPARADAGVVDITLTASEGESTAESFTILVTTNEAPAVHLGFDTQIANPDLHNFNTATSLPSNDGVLIHPYYSFSMGFQQSTFRPGYMAFDRDIYYSAHLRGTNSLPSWLNFDNNTVTFSGVAPPSGTFVIVVIGSDYWGYSGVENSFTIQVSTEYIDVPETAGLGNITTVAGSAVDFVLDLSQVDVNGNTPKMSDLEITADLTNFPWLSFDA